MKKLLVVQLLFVAYTLVLLCIGRCTVGKEKDSPTSAPEVSADTIYIDRWLPSEVIKVPVPADVDTAAIVQQYYTQNVYNRPVIDNKLLQVNIIDTVYNNVLLGSTATYTMRIPQYRHGVSVGVVAGYNTLSVMGTYRYDRLGVSAGYDFINRGLVFGLQYRLFRW